MADELYDLLDLVFATKISVRCSPNVLDLKERVPCLEVTRRRFPSQHHSTPCRSTSCLERRTSPVLTLTRWRLSSDPTQSREVEGSRLQTRGEEEGGRKVLMVFCLDTRNISVLISLLVAAAVTQPLLW